MLQASADFARGQNPSLDSLRSILWICGEDISKHYYTLYIQDDDDDDDYDDYNDYYYDDDYYDYDYDYYINI